MTTLVVVAFFTCFGFYARLTASKALQEEKEFWNQADRLTPEQRTQIRNHMIRSRKAPSIMPWCEMDGDNCAPYAWKVINLLSGIKLNHAKGRGGAWQLRSQNKGKLATKWQADQSENFLEMLTKLDQRGLYLVGFRWANTRHGDEIEKAQEDSNSHVVVYTGGEFIHMYSPEGCDPLVIESSESFLDDGKMLPVWITEVTPSNGKAFRFAKTKETLKLEQKIWKWSSLHWWLSIPDRPFHINIARPVTYMERAILNLVKGDYEQYPHLPLGE